MLMLPSLGPAQDAEKCLESIKEIVKDNPVHKEKFKEFLKLQAGLTMHKMAYSLFRKDISKTGFFIEKEIFNILQTMEEKRDSDPEFEKVYQMYNHPKNKLSRHALAEVLPYIQNILNDQIHESDPFKRQHLILGQADIKMLAILTEKEKKYNNGSYAQILSANRESDNSVLNFVKMINSSIRNTNDSVDNIRSTMLRRIGVLNYQIKELFEDLPIGPECEALILTCKKDQTGNEKPVMNQEFLGVMLKAVNELDVEDKYKYLRYGDVWLYTKGRVGGRSSRSGGSSGGGKAKTYKKVKTEVKKSDKEVVLDYLVQHVLDHLPNFFTREDLFKDPELTYALARAIDEGALSKKDPKDRVFFYKGKAYSIPEMWNTSYSSKFGINMSQYGRKANKWIFRNIWMDDEEIDIPKNIKKELHEEFLNVRNEQKQKFGHTMTFVFKDELYDIATGKKIPKTKESIFAYPYTGDDVKEKTYPKVSDANLKLMADEVRKGYRAYINGEKAYHVSGAAVDPKKEYERAKGHFNATNTNISGEGTVSFPTESELISFYKKNPSTGNIILKGLADRNRAVSNDGDLYDMYTLEPITKDGAIRIITGNLGKYNVNVDNSSYQSFDNNYLKARAESILNSRPSFTVDNKEYHTDNGRVIRDKVPTGSVYRGYVDHDAVNDELLKINAGTDLHVISTFHKGYGMPKDCSTYTVIDKKEAKLMVLDKDKNLVFESEVLLGENKADHRSRYSDDTNGVTNNISGAGIYSMQIKDVKGAHVNEEDFQDPPLYLNYITQDGSQDQSPVAISGVSKYHSDRNPRFNNGSIEDNRVTNGAIVMPNSKMKEYARYKKQGCPLYVLPETGEVKFKIVEDQLSLTATDPGRVVAGEFNLTPQPEVHAKDIKVTITDDRYKAPVTEKFIETLQDKKADLMKELGLTNAEYNELTKLAFGIMGTESGFGSEKMFKIKEKRIFGMQVGQYLVDAMKGKTLKVTPGGAPMPLTMLIGDSGNSRGLTQVKDIRSYLKEKHPGIDGTNLNRPENAAIATMYVLASKLQTMKRVEQKHSGIDEANRMDYLYYLYMGSANQITKGSATPYLNTKAKEVIGYSEKISVLTTP
jgi:hypothetical protein